MTGGAGDQWDHLCHQERLALARCSARVRSAQERSITDLCAGAALACSTRFGSRVRSPSLKCQSAHTVAELFGNSRSQQLAGGKPSDVLALCWILESAARDRSLNLLGQGAALTRFVRFLARARAAPSASGFDPAAPARSYRVGSGTTRSKPLAEGIAALTLVWPFPAREAPERSEYRQGRHILHLWRCPKCDYCFEGFGEVDRSPARWPGASVRMDRDQRARNDRVRVLMKKRPRPPSLGRTGTGQGRPSDPRR
jgi:hypothetical protein